MADNKIEHLVFSFMKLVGMEPKRDHNNLWRAEVPEAERAFFNGQTEFQFTFDREEAERHRELDYLCEGAFLLRKIVERLGAIPKVSRLYGTMPPELPPADPGKMRGLRVVTTDAAYYRQQVVFTFKVIINSDNRRERCFSVLADPMSADLSLKEGLREIDLTRFSETPDPALPLAESGEDLLRLYLQACQSLEQTLAPEIKSMQDLVQDRYVVEQEKVTRYIDEQKRELQRKKENVCFHLYFFQKEEEIDKMIAGLEAEQQRKLEELKEKFALNVDIRLINAVVLCLPTFGTPRVDSNVAPKRPAEIVPLRPRRAENRGTRPLNG
jgi:hypothetical protein